MKILRAFGKSVIIVLIPILVGLLGDIISPDWTEKIKATYPNYLGWLSILLATLAIILFIWEIREETRKEESKNAKEGGIHIFQSGKTIDKKAKVTGLQTNGQIPSGSVEQRFDTVKGELTGINVSDNDQDV